MRKSPVSGVVSTRSGFRGSGKLHTARAVLKMQTVWGGWAHLQRGRAHHTDGGCLRTGRRERERKRAARRARHSEHGWAWLGLCEANALPCGARKKRQRNREWCGRRCATAMGNGRAAGRVAVVMAHAAARTMTAAATTRCRQKRWRWRCQTWWARWVWVAVAGRRAHARVQPRAISHRALRAVVAPQHSENGRGVEREQQHGSASPERPASIHATASARDRGAGERFE